MTNLEGHSPRICNFQHCGVTSGSEMPCPFKKDLPRDELWRKAQEAGSTFDGCQHEWRQYLTRVEGTSYSYPDGFYCIYCLDRKTMA